MRGQGEDAARRRGSEAIKTKGLTDAAARKRSAEIGNMAAEERQPGADMTVWTDHTVYGAGVQVAAKKGKSAAVKK